MIVIIVVSCNIVICLINLLIVVVLVKLKKHLSNFNRDLIDLEKKVIVELKQIPLNILLTALEIQEYKNKYQQIQFQLKKVRQFIIISRYIYKASQGKFI